MFEGTYTAIITPFRRDGSVDYEKLDQLVEMQIEGGVTGIVPVGTTGESPTLNTEEHIEVIRAVAMRCRGRAKVIAGTGANSTSEAVELTEAVREMGVDATLQVTPYYNKPNQAGLIAHFSAVADLGLPVVLYNVPGRSSREIAVETIVELSRHPNIVCVKEAGGSVDRVSHIRRLCDIEILSGDDSLTLPMMAVGATGVISVATNVAPEPVAAMVADALAGRWEEARKLHLKYHRLFCDLFLDTNPIPVKAALAMMGLIEEVYRLPLCPMSDALKKKLADCLREVNLI
ncbi:MAG TPA: 4-hydroxy-tetrahydrodipicolinate synthase [Kiritimatiellia bacterium]|nr:4-hydroxy-tetrahydrodipicolinate synthase [Kiritimatiellia bacterium]HQQ03555.1 4-hydroxy-tetrahydrodipicolinate synthase [Kiritimatiellia bacterium]